MGAPRPTVKLWIKIQRAKVKTGDESCEKAGLSQKDESCDWKKRKGINSSKPVHRSQGILGQYNNRRALDLFKKVKDGFVLYVCFIF